MICFNAHVAESSIERNVVMKPTELLAPLGSKGTLLAFRSKAPFWKIEAFCGVELVRKKRASFLASHVCLTRAINLERYFAQNYYTVQNIQIFGEKVGPAVAGSAEPVATPMCVIVVKKLHAKAV